MKKIQLVEIVTDFLANELSQDMITQYHPEIIKKYIENAFNQVVYQVWFNGKKFSDYSQLDAWTKTYPLALYNSALVGSYVRGNLRLPYPPMQLPNNMGIRQVASAVDETIVFAYLENTAPAIFNELEVSSIDTTPTFRLEQNDTGAGMETHILKCDHIPTSIYNVLPILTYFNVKMIVPLEEIGDYEDVAMPAGQEDLLVKQTIEFLSKKPPPDTSNDQVAQRTTQ
jgi:hypothetical protein